MEEALAAEIAGPDIESNLLAIDVEASEALGVTFEWNDDLGLVVTAIDKTKAASLPAEVT
jgi:hypothetical protein